MHEALKDRESREREKERNRGRKRKVVITGKYLAEQLRSVSYMFKMHPPWQGISQSLVKGGVGGKEGKA